MLREAGGASPSVDKIVGKQIRIFRLAKGIRPETLAGRIGVSFQQISRYKIGQNRVTAGILLEIAGALGVPIECFFDGSKSSLCPKRTASML